MPRLAAVAMSLVVVAAVVLAVAQVVTQSRLNTARAQQAALSAVLSAPDARTATAQVQNGGTVTVVYSHDERRMIFTAHGLPPLTGGLLALNARAGTASWTAGERSSPRGVARSKRRSRSRRT